MTAIGARPPLRGGPIDGAGDHVAAVGRRGIGKQIVPAFWIHPIPDGACKHKVVASCVEPGRHVARRDKPCLHVSPQGLVMPGSHVGPRKNVDPPHLARRLRWFSRMGPQSVVDVVFRREIDQAEDPLAARQQKIDEYTEKSANPYQAAQLGYVDEVILPEDTRFRFIQVLRALRHKQDRNPPRKHGNMPL